jgi:hypothetical protein
MTSELQDRPSEAFSAPPRPRFAAGAFRSAAGEWQRISVWTHILVERQIAHQANRRYNSAFFWST